MTKEVVKKAYDLAQKEIEEKQIEKVKDIVKDTLKRIKDLEEEIKILEDEKKILKLDLDDLKEGRLDRIEDRQSKDEKSKKASIIKVLKIKEVHHHHNDWWYQPYKITYVPYTPITFPSNPTWCFGSSSSGNTSASYAGTALTPLSISTSTTNGSAIDASFTLCGSVAKNNVTGTYDLGNKIVHLR